MASSGSPLADKACKRRRDRGDQERPCRDDRAGTTHRPSRRRWRTSAAPPSSCAFHDVSPRCQSAWQPNPGRRSTYRRGKSVQTTGPTSGYARSRPRALVRDGAPQIRSSTNRGNDIAIFKRREDCQCVNGRHWQAGTSPSRATSRVCNVRGACGCSYTTRPPMRNPLRGPRWILGRPSADTLSRAGAVGKCGVPAKRDEPSQAARQPQGTAAAPRC